MTRTKLILLAAGGSGALMLGALGFQYIGEMPPCKMCYWQRYPHVAAIGIGVLALVFKSRLFPILGAIAAFATAIIGGFHSGVERGWWEGPSTCTSGSISDLSATELMAQIMDAPLVRCDEIPWEFLTLSMAGWNMLVSLCLTALWISAALKR